MSLREALAHSSELLTEAGCASPRVDAEIILEHVLSRSRAQLYAAPEQLLDTAQRDELRRKLRRRCAREPLAYVIGEWGFRRLRLRVTSDVLVPRPETEVLVERCLEHLRDHAQPRVLEIGTGSGAIALAIADEHAGADLIAIDISQAALDVAANNAARLGLDHRVSLVHGDLFAGQTGPFELVVSNPPYVSAESYASLEPEVAQYEPRVALIGSTFHRRIAEHAPTVLEPSGWLVMETGDDQAAEIAERMRVLGWSDVGVMADLTDRPRIVEGRQPAIVLASA